MKYIFIALLFIASTSNAQDSTGNFTVKAPIQFWQNILDALDKSSAPHNLISDLNKFIIAQIELQVKKKEPPKKEGKKE